MAHLVLSRKLDQAVKVGDHLITVTRVGRAIASLATASPKKVHTCEIGDMVILEAGVSVTLQAINRGIVKLAFDAPREVKIVRLELLNDDAS